MTASPGGFPTWLAALLRCGSCRFTAFYFLPFFAAIARDGRGTWAWGVVGFGYWSFHSLGTELVNRLADRTEDVINRPERTALCERVGWPGLHRVAVLAWVIVATLDVAWLTLHPQIGLAVLLALAGLFAVGYSYGPRLKRSRYLSLLVLTFPFCGTFLTGWAVGGPDGAADRARDFWQSALPFALLLGMFITSLAGMKDITDVVGDELVGYRSVWVQFVSDRTAWLVAAAVSVPFAALLILVATGLLPSRLLALVVFAPLSWLAATLGQRASTPAERDAAREAAYQYWGIFLAFALLLYAPSWPLAVATVSTTVYWVSATRWLHWSNGISFDKVRLLVDLLSVSCSTKART